MAVTDEEFLKRMFDNIIELDKRNPRQVELIAKMVDLQLTKGHDYSGQAHDTLDNLRCAQEVDIAPWIGVLIRAGDKWRRITNYAKARTLKVRDESFRATCLDLANYALFATQLHDEEPEVDDSDEKDSPVRYETPAEKAYQAGRLGRF